MLTASGPKPVRAIEKILLVDGIHQINHHFLHDLILKAGNRDGSRFPVLLGDKDAAQRLYLILACHKPPMQLTDVLLGVGLVLCIRDPVDPGTGFPSQIPKCLIQLFHCDQVSDGVKLSLRIRPGRHRLPVGRCLDHARGFPCCIDLPLVCMLSPLPRWNRKVHLSLSSSAISAFPEIMAGRLPHHVFRGLLSVHSRYGLHTHQVTFMTLYTGGFSRFVTSTTAPIATGWNESCRAGFAPAGKPCLCTAHMTM